MNEDHRPSSSNTPCLRAFTLVEIVLVLVIVVIVGLIAQPRFVSAMTNDRIFRSAHRVASDLRLAQSEAIKQQQDVTVSFDKAEGAYTLTPLSADSKGDTSVTVDLDDDPSYLTTLQSVDFSGKGTVTFNAFGVPDSGGAVAVGVGTMSCTISLNSLTGHVSVGGLVYTPTATD